MSWVDLLKDWWRGKPLVGRSSDWPALRQRHLAKQPRCQVCDSLVNVVPHHVRPVHKYPESELDSSNLVSLCEGKVVNCHLLYGHLRNWASWNPAVTEDARTWREKIARRPV